MNCEIKQYISFLYGLDTDHRYIEYDDFNGDSQTLSDKVEALMQDMRQRDDFRPYDYIIIDEAQDTFNKNILCVLNNMSYSSSKGLENGRYLVFYDTEQGYNNAERELDSYAESLVKRGCHFLLNENKRVPTNREIVEYANVLLKGEVFDGNVFLNNIEELNNSAISIQRFRGTKEVVRYIRDKMTEIKDHSLNWQDYSLLADSHTKHLQCGNDETLYERICDMERIKELTPNNVGRNESKLQFSTILAYKGLENKHIVLLMSSRTELDRFELYVGMTRAIYDLEIIVLE